MVVTRNKRPSKIDTHDASISLKQHRRKRTGAARKSTEIEPVPANKCGRPGCKMPLNFGMECSKCKKLFHEPCTNMDPVEYRNYEVHVNLKWHCPMCSANSDATEDMETIGEAISILTKNSSLYENTYSIGDAELVSQYTDCNENLTQPTQENSTASKTDDSLSETCLKKRKRSKLKDLTTQSERQSCSEPQSSDEKTPIERQQVQIKLSSASPIANLTTQSERQSCSESQSSDEKTPIERQQVQIQLSSVSPISNPTTHQSKKQPCSESQSFQKTPFERQKEQTKASSVRPVPNFHRIHALAASKMESLPQFMHRIQAKRPPFASPPYRPASGIADGSISESNRALQDLSNQTSNPVLNQHGSNQTATVVKLDSSLHSMTQSLVSANFKPQIQKYTPKIAADSAFARRKAYDLKRNLARLSGHAPHRMSSTTAVSHAHGASTVNTATSSTPALAKLSGNSQSTTTVPRIDPREHRPGLSVTAQRERNVSITQTKRQQARQAIADSRRGLL